MLTITISVFAIAAIGGLVLAIKVLSGRLAPWPLGIIHALLGATGLVLLFYQVLIVGSNNRLLFALIILIWAALAGFYLFSLHFKNIVAPKGTVLIHGGIAVIGFLTLLSAVL